MKEHFDIDMEGQYSKLISEIPSPDILITMGCKDGVSVKTQNIFALSL